MHIYLYMCTVAESKIYIYIYILFGWLIKIIHLPFFFFSFFHASLSLSLSLSHSLSSLKPTLSTPVSLSRSSPPIEVPDWETHGARCWSECLLVDIGSFMLLMVVSRHRSEIWVFFFFFLLWTAGGGGVDGGCGCMGYIILL